MLPSIFHLGPLTLHTYGLLVAVGFLVALSVLRRTSRHAGIAADDVDRLSIWLLVSGLLGARVMFFAVDGFAGLRGDPLSFFRLWEGGLAFYGGVIGALAAMFWFARSRKIRPLAVADALVPPLLIGHAFGRLGCLAAGCCYGRPAGGWPGILFSDPACLAPLHVKLLPTQPLEAAILALLFWAAYAIFRRNPPVGRLSAFYLCGYAAARFGLEFLRGDDRGAGVMGLSPSQAVAVILFGVGIFVWYRFSRRRSPEDR